MYFLEIKNYISLGTKRNFSGRSLNAMISYKNCRNRGGNMGDQKSDILRLNMLGLSRLTVGTPLEDVVLIIVFLGGYTVTRSECLSRYFQGLFEFPVFI